MMYLFLTLTFFFLIAIIAFLSITSYQRDLLVAVSLPTFLSINNKAMTVALTLQIERR